MACALQKAIQASSLAQGWNHTFVIPSFFTSSSNHKVIWGGVMKIATSTVVVSHSDPRWVKTFCPSIVPHLGLIGKIVYFLSNKSLKTLYPYFSGLFDAPTRA